MSAHIYDVMAGRVPQQQIGGARQTLPSHHAPALPSQDPIKAKTCARFIAHHFSIYAPPAGVESLDKFIARIIYRTQYRSNTTFAALYLIGLLKGWFLDRLDSDSKVSCHRLFLAAFMVVSKSIHDDTYSNKSFAELAKEVATVNDINSMEREILRYVDWKVNIPNHVVEEFRRMVERDFRGAGPYPTYRYAAPGASDAPLQIPTAILAESPVSGALTTRPVLSSAFLSSQPKVSYPPSRTELPRSMRIVTTSDSAPTMRQVHRAPQSITLPSAGPLRVATYPPPPQPVVAAPVANPYMRQTDPSRMATPPFLSHIHSAVCPSGMMVSTRAVDNDWVVISSGGHTILW